MKKAILILISIMISAIFSPTVLASETSIEYVIDRAESEAAL